MRDVLDERRRGWWDAGEPFGAGHRRRHLAAARRGQPARRWRSAPTARRSAACPAAASRARSTSWPRRSLATGRAGAAALRRQRRRRVRRRADLRRHPRRLRRAGRPRRRSPSSARSPRRSRAHEPVAVATVVDGPRRDRRAGALVLAGPRRPARSAPSGSTTRSPTTPAACSPQGATGVLHYGRDGERRGDELAVFVAVVRAAAADAGVRRDRLRRRGRPGRHVPRLPRHRLRRAAGLRHARSGSPTPTRWSSSGRTATSASEPTVDERTVICVLTHDPKFDVPLLEVALRTAGGLRRRDGLPAHPRRPARPAARGRADRGRAGPAVARRSASTSAPARRRRPRCRSPPRSSPAAGAAPAPAGRDRRRRSTATRPGRGAPGPRGAVTRRRAGARRRRRQPVRRPKALVELDGERLVDRAVRVLREGGLRRRSSSCSGAAD